MAKARTSSISTVSGKARARTTPVAPAGNINDQAYAAFLQRLDARFNALHDEPLFTTDATGLFDAYLAAMPKTERQFHNCHACRKFIEQYGGLVRIMEDGTTLSAVWSLAPNHIPSEYRKSIAQMDAIVLKAKVTGVFLSSEKVLGLPKTGAWRHMALINNAVFKATVVRSAFQAMAEKQTEFETVVRALSDYSLESLHQVTALLGADVLYRSEKVLGQAQWLLALQDTISVTPNRRYLNVIRRAVALAPAGFCHPRSSMIGTLLDDLAIGMSFTDAAARFREKMSPTRYQRPQAPPKAGNVISATRMFQALGLERSLLRRFARLEEVLPHAIWYTPASPETPRRPAGPFAHLLGSLQRTVRTVRTMEAVDPQHITWRKFAALVLPSAQKVELYVDPTNYHPIAGLVTATDEDAPPIIQWDLPHLRNPFTWYVYQKGSKAQDWALQAGVWHHVPAVVPKPSLWNAQRYDHHGEGVIFVLPTARDLQRPGLALFPEFLKAELREVRSTIEAHSNQGGQISGGQFGNANGYLLNDGQPAHPRLRVTLPGNLRVIYIIDRWD